MDKFVVVFNNKNKLVYIDGFAKNLVIPKKIIDLFPTSWHTKRADEVEVRFYLNRKTRILEDVDLYKNNRIISYYGCNLTSKHRYANAIDEFLQPITTLEILCHAVLNQKDNSFSRFTKNTYYDFHMIQLIAKYIR